MKAHTLITLVTLAMSPGLVLATGAAHETGGHSKDSAPLGGQPMSGMTDGGMSMMSMQKKMQEMRAQMATINKTQDPQRRDELVRQHMDSMREMMKTMQGGREGKPGMQQGGSMEKMMNQQKMMEQRMDMMQMMMDQMMQNQAAAEETQRIRARIHDPRQMK